MDVEGCSGSTPIANVGPAKSACIHKFNCRLGIQTFFTLMCTKVSICFFLLRIPTSRAFIRPLQASIIVLIVSNIILTFIWIFQCWPVALAWDSTVPGRCFSRQFLLNLILAQAIISVVSDFALALCPIIILRNVRMRRRQKVGLCLLMGLGVIVGVCCVIRTAFNGGALPTDATFGGITNWFWRLFEVQLGIVCACIPPIIPGYKWAKQKLERSWHSQDTTLTSDNLRPPVVTIGDPARDSPDLEQERRGRGLQSEIPRSEKALLGKALNGKGVSPDGISPDGFGEKHSDEDLGKKTSQKGMRTFFNNDTNHEEERRVASPTRVIPQVRAAKRRSQNISFSRRDLKHQAPLSPPQKAHGDAADDIPHLLVTPAEAGRPAFAPRTVGSTSTQSMVTETDDPVRPLDFVDLQPRQFERNRGLFARILDMKRSSWTSWMSSNSSRGGGSQGASVTDSVV